MQNSEACYVKIPRLISLHMLTFVWTLTQKFSVTNVMILFDTECLIEKQNVR